jgi:serine protease Do
MSHSRFHSMQNKPLKAISTIFAILLLIKKSPPNTQSQGEHISRLILAVVILPIVALACSIGIDPTSTPSATTSATATSTISPPNVAEPVESFLPSVSNVVADVKPSVVSIAVKTMIEQCDFFYGCRTIEQDGAGTGVIFDNEGFIVTNNHVINGASKITVFLIDEQTFDAKLIGRDPTTDLAVIKIPKGNYGAVDFADPEKLRVGDWVIAIGNALDLDGGPTVTIGIIGALDRIIDTEGSRLFDMIQTDAAINPGNSGGPLINLDGKIVGINTARDQQGQGIGFAVNTSTIVPVVESILEHGRVIFAWLGVGVSEVTPIIASQEGISVSRGILIDNVALGGPAILSGILSGDVIITFDGTDVDTVKQLQRAIRGYDIGHQADVTVVRGNDTKIYQVTLEEQPRGL